MRLRTRLERSMWDLFWLPPDAVPVERPGLLFVRCPRDLRFLNAVYRVSLRARDVDRAVGEVDSSLAGVRSVWQLPEHVRSRALDHRLAAAGWAPAAQHHACGLDAGAEWRGPTKAWRVETVTTPDALRDWHRVGELAFGEQSSPRSDEQLADELANPRVFRALARDAHGEPVSAGGLNLFPALGFGFLWGGGTVPHARGGGAYTAVVDARVRRARTAGIGAVGLYARVETSWPVVAKLGFRADGLHESWNRG